MSLSFEVARLARAFARAIWIALPLAAASHPALSDEPSSLRVPTAAWHCTNESTCLKKTGGKAVRHGLTLEIKTKSGKVLTFKDSPPDCSPSEEEEPPVTCNRFRLTGYSQRDGLFVVANDGDPPSFDVVSWTLGKPIFSQTGETIFSPDGSHLVSFMSSSEIATYHLEILAVSAEQLRSEFNNDSVDEGEGKIQIASPVKWKSNDRVDYKTKRSTGSGDVEADTSVVRTKTGWTIVRKDGKKIGN